MQVNNVRIYLDSSSFSSSFSRKFFGFFAGLFAFLLGKPGRKDPDPDPNPTRSSPTGPEPDPKHRTIVTSFILCTQRSSWNRSLPMRKKRTIIRLKNPQSWLYRTQISWLFIWLTGNHWLIYMYVDSQELAETNKQNKGETYENHNNLKCYYWRKCWD